MTHDVEVLTTCARDYITWQNEYPEGSDRVRGVTIRRFATARTRDLDAFNKYSDWIYNHTHTRHDELERPVHRHELDSGRVHDRVGRIRRHGDSERGPGT